MDIIRERFNDFFSRTEMYEHPVYYDFIASLCKGSTLDMGCANACHLTSRVARSLGLDFSITAIRQCRDKGYPGLVGDVHCLPFRDESFDTVTSLGTLEHFQHPEKAVAEMNRVLKKEGTLIITTDAPANIVFTIGDFIRIIEYRIRGTLLTQPVDNRIPKKKVMEILASNGFRVVFNGEYSARVVQTDRYTRILKKIFPERWLRGSFVYFFYCKKGTFDRNDGYGPFFPIR